MPRRFKDTEDPKKARTDWKKEKNRVQQREDSVQQHAERASVRRGGGVQNLMSRRMGGGAPGGGGPGGGLDGMMRHPAVEFGRQMTGGVGDAASASIRNMVMQRLMQKGISQDGSGTWQIAGLNRPTDPGLAIRNSAIAAMDPSGEMLRRVLGASPMPGAIRGMPSGMGGVPSPGLGAGSLPIGPQNGMPLPPVRPPMPMPTPGGGMQSVPPGLPGGPPMPGAPPSMPTSGGMNPGTSLPPIPMGKGPTNAPPPASPPFPPQGQGVGRTTTPTGAEIDPTKYPPTNQPSLGLPPAGTAGGLNQPPPVRGDYPRPTPGSGTSMQGTNRPGGPDYVLPSGSSALPTAGMAGGLNQVAPPPKPSGGLGAALPSLTPGDGGWNEGPGPAPGGMLPGSMPPPSVASDIYRPPGTMPPPAPGLVGGGYNPPGGGSNTALPLPPPRTSSPPMSSTVPGAGGPVPSPGLGGENNTMLNFANPGGALTQRLQQGRPGTPPSPGRAPTPMVAPGAMPGQSTPFNPAQMAQQGMKLPAIPRPTGFGTPGQTQVPGARQPVSLANLGQSIQATVASRVGAAQAGIRPGVSPATPGSPVGNSLDDLGERIRAAVAGNNGNVQPAAPGAGGTNLGQATTSIMDRVRQQLSQAGMPAGGIQNPNGTTPFPTPGGMTPAGMPAPSGPSTGTMPGAAPIPPGGVPSAMAAPSTTTSPSGGIGAPTGTINCQFGYGCGGDWSSVNQYDASFASAGQKWGVDPAMLKAMAVIESGGQMIEGPAGAYGVMQIKEGDWGWLANQLGVSLSTPEGQIEVAAAILGQYGNGSNPQERFLNSYYPTPCYTCPPGDQDNGITQEVYWNNMQGLISTINGAGGGTTTAPTTVDPTTDQPTGQLPPGANTPIAGGGPTETQTPNTSLIPGMDTPRSDGTTPAPLPAPTNVIAPVDPGTIQDTSYVPGGGLGKYGGIPNTEPRAVMNAENLAYLDMLGAGAAQSALAGGYGFGSPNACGPTCYDSYWGWDPNYHPALDVNMGSPTASVPYNSLVSGTVICVGDGNYGNPSPNTGCGAYPDYQNGGFGGEYSSGNLSILTDDQAIVTYGHSTNLAPGIKGGGQVSAGQQLAMTGSMTGGDGYHVHLEVQLPLGPNGEYTLVDPDMYFNGYYCDRGYCPYS